MKNKLFKVSYILFVISMVVIFTVNIIGLISFGIDGTNQLTEIGIVVTLIISIPIFIIINKNKKENILSKMIRLFWVIIMIGILYFLISDSFLHNSGKG